MGQAEQEGAQKSQTTVPCLVLPKLMQLLYDKPKYMSTFWKTSGSTGADVAFTITDKAKLSGTGMFSIVRCSRKMIIKPVIKLNANFFMSNIKHVFF